MQPRSNCSKCRQWLSTVLGMLNSLASSFLRLCLPTVSIMGICSQLLTSRVSHAQTQSTVQARKCLGKTCVDISFLSLFLYQEPNTIVQGVYNALDALVTQG